MYENRKNVAIIGGGTVSHVRSHLALCAPAYGSTAKKLANLCLDESNDLKVNLYLTKMADSSSVFETNEDVTFLVDKLVKNPSTKIIFFNPALVDYQGQILQGGVVTPSGKYENRLKTRDDAFPVMQLKATPKVASRIRKDRKDIFLVTFKTTCGATPEEQYLAALNMLKETSSNLVLANDVGTRVNMIVTPEEAVYHQTTDRDEALKNLVEMAYLRSHLTFTRATVVSGQPVPWSAPEVPANLRKVVDYCIAQGAYKSFRGATVGHFAAKVDEKTFLTSRRRTNFNQLPALGLVKIETDGPDTVLAYGSKPSVGGQSQRIVFSDHPGMDCIVHFHCPIKSDSKVPRVSQREYECGSHECGRNTSNGLQQFGNLLAVFLDNHGPNIVFSKDTDPDEVIRFIEENFDLAGKTGGYMLPKEPI
jgi:hypothetical protein